MTTISCPRCETTFESQATTATRCRSCRSVVHIGRRSASGAQPRRSTASPPGTRVRSGEGVPRGSYAETGDARGDLFVLLGVLVVAAGFAGWWWWRKRKATERGVGTPAPDLVLGAPNATVTRLFEPATSSCPVCATGMARCAFAGCPMPA